MRVLVFQLDGKKPNLAAMKMAAWHRAAGDVVELRQVAEPMDLQPRLGDPDWERVCGSLIFERTKPLAQLAQKIYPHIELGGTGWDLEGGRMVRSTPLPVEVEAMPPDYSDYTRDGVLVDAVNYSIGFAERGLPAVVRVLRRADEGRQAAIGCDAGADLAWPRPRTARDAAR
jgi:hypothetical protein